MPLYSSTRAADIIVPPGEVLLGALAWVGANTAVFTRFSIERAMPIRYINWRVAAQSGNVQLGIVSLSGTLRTSYTRIAHTGLIACPAVGSIRTDLGVQNIGPGDYAAFLWADNTTFQSHRATNSGVAALRTGATHAGLATGVQASGTLTWDTSRQVLTLEGDLA